MRKIGEDTHTHTCEYFLLGVSSVGNCIFGSETPEVKFAANICCREKCVNGDFIYFWGAKRGRIFFVFLLSLYVVLFL